MVVWRNVKSGVYLSVHHKVVIDFTQVDLKQSLTLWCIRFELVSLVIAVRRCMDFLPYIVFSSSSFRLGRVSADTYVKLIIAKPCNDTIDGRCQRVTVQMLYHRYMSIFTD